MLRSLRTYYRLLVEDRENGWGAKIFYPFLDLASWIYGAASQLIRGLHEKKILARHRLPFPVISVGNLTWGGTGKTPLVEYLARKVIEHHRNPLILTRGYSHDEIEQYRNHLPNAVIGVGRDRAQVSRQMAAKHRVHVAILDDGLQHWAVERDIEIIVINALNPFGNHKLVPRGILREPVWVLRKAAIVVISNCNLVDPKELEHLRKMIQKINPKSFIVEAYLEALFLYRAGKNKRVSLHQMVNQKVTTFSGVGTPRSFQMLLAQSKIRPMRNFEFSDHHVYTEKELEEIKKVSESAGVSDIITTEKDFFRSPETIAKVLNPLVLATRIRIASGEEILTDRLFRLLGVTRS